MFEVPNSIPRLRPWLLALLWMGVAVVHLASTSLLYPLLFNLLDIGVDNYRIVSGVVVVVSGLFTLLLQWLVLRRFFPAMAWWVPAHAAVLIVGVALQDLLTRLAAALMFARAISGAGGISGDNAGLSAGALVQLIWTTLIGLVGWWLFRPLTRRAWLWPAALLLGALLQILMNVLVLWPLLTDGIGGTNTARFALISVAVNLLGAAAQAAVLVLFLRERQRPDGGLSTQLEYQ
jgi:hypothetical protein